MEYYILSQRTGIKNVAELEIKPKNPMNWKMEMDLNSTKPLQGSFNLFVKSSPYNVYPDFIEIPIPLVTSQMKKIFSAYESHIHWNCVILSDRIQKVQHIYWLMMLEKINCIDESTEFYKNDAIKKLVLNQKKVGSRKVFRVGGIREKYVVINLDVVESLLRRPVNGVELRRIDSK